MVCEHPECCSGKPAEFVAWVGHGRMILMSLCRDCVKYSRAAEAKGTERALAEACDDEGNATEMDVLAEENLALTNALHRVADALGIQYSCVGLHGGVAELANQCLEAIEELRNDH